MAIIRFNLVSGEESFSSLVNPGVRMPEDAFGIHGISDEMVRGAPAVGDILDEIEENPDNFAEFTKMEPAQEHQMMQDFIDRKVKERNLAEDLVDALSKPKAATGFKFLIDGSKYKDEWVTYRKSKYHDWVKEQVDSFNYAED